MLIPEEKIEEIMEKCDWDDKSCRLIRQHINPVAVDDRDLSEKPLEEVLNIFEERLSKEEKENKKDRQEVHIEFD